MYRLLKIIEIFNFGVGIIHDFSEKCNLKMENKNFITLKAIKNLEIRVNSK